jgi:hypothetical protein
MDTELAAARFRVEAAAFRFRLAAHRLILALRYNPNWHLQPRVPAGNPDGGQWTRIGEGAEEGRIQLVQGDRIEGFPVDLREDEALGGHTISGHVGKSREFLLNRIREERLRILEREPRLTREHPELFRGFAVSSFTSLEAANRLVNATLARNQEEVRRVASGELPAARIRWRFPSVTGFQAYLPRLHSTPVIRDTYGARVRIIHDPRLPKGFRVQTAFPEE